MSTRQGGMATLVILGSKQKGSDLVSETLDMSSVSSRHSCSIYKNKNSRTWEGGTHWKDSSSGRGEGEWGVGRAA